MTLSHLSILSGKKFGNIILTKAIGSGTFGVVYLAERQGEEIAVKVSDDKDAVEHESRIMKEMIGINGICQWIQNESCDGMHILAMELGYMDMEKLRKLQKNKSFGPTILQKMTWQVTAALEALHARGFAHRDIKLNNLMITIPDENSVVFIKILDFGVARRKRNPDGSLVLEKDMLYDFSSMLLATPYTISGTDPDFIDDFLQYSYNLIRGTNDPMKPFFESKESRNIYKNHLLVMPGRVLSPEIEYLFPFMRAIGQYRPFDDIDYDLIREAVQNMIPENDARSNIFIELVDGKPTLN